MTRVVSRPAYISPIRVLWPSLRRILTRAQRLQMWVYVALSLGSALASSVAAILLVPLVQPGQADAWFGGLLRPRGGIDQQALWFGTATAVFALLRWLAARLGARLTACYAVGLRQQVHARLLDAPLSRLTDATSAEIVNVLTHNGEILVQGFSAMLQLQVMSVTSAISLGLAFYLSPVLMLGMPFLIAFGVFASRLFGREQSHVSRQYVADFTELFWHSEDFPRRLRHVRSFERERAEQDNYGEISQRLGRGYRRQLELVASGRLMLELVAAIGIAGVFVLAHHWHGVEPGALIAVSLLVGRLLPYLISARQSAQQLLLAVPAYELWRRYVEFDEAWSDDAPLGHAASVNAPPRASQPIHIERVHITPPFPVLEVTRLTLVPGELTLVAGDSGIGKSSLVDVLAGMMSPVTFAARIGDQTVDFSAYREHVRRGAYVSQSVRPWQRTVRDCLRWAAPEASEAQMHAALADVGLTRRLTASSDGLDTVLVGAANRFSGGELQRLLLAQVILRRPTLAVLDEATSALDAASELAVLTNLRARLPDTALIVVSHRSTVEEIADQCLRIDAQLRTMIHVRHRVEAV